MELIWQRKKKYGKIRINEKGDMLNMGKNDNKMELVKLEDVIVEKNGEFKPDNSMASVLMRGRKSMANMFDNLGFRGFEFVHPRFGHKVIFFVKGDMVVMIDYHGANTLVVEVLNEEEREWFMESVEEHLGLEEIEKLKK